MPSRVISPAHLSNPLATIEQLSSSSSSSALDRVPSALETSVRYAGARLTQAAGVLVRLPQDVIARAIVLFTRFWLGPEGGSLRQFDADRVSAACLYLMAKLSADPQSPRNILNVYAYLSAQLRCVPSDDSGGGEPPTISPESYHLSEGEYLRRRTALLKTEAHVLRLLGFETHVALPHTLAINYLQALDVFDGSPRAARLSRRTIAHLNTALFSPQLVYLTHQPPALATAAIYLAAREVGVALPADEEWWTVFDVDREELGFLVVGMISMEGFALAESEKWRGRTVPLDVEGVEREMERLPLAGGDG